MEDKSVFNYDEKLFYAMSLINFKSTNINFRQSILKELIDNNCSKEKDLIFFEYIYNNNLRNNWSQKDFSDFAYKIKDKIPIIIPKINASFFDIMPRGIGLAFVLSMLLSISSSNHIFIDADEPAPRVIDNKTKK